MVHWIKNKIDKETGNGKKLYEAKGMVSEQTNTVWFSPVPGVILIFVLSVINYMIHTEN